MTTSPGPAGRITIIDRVRTPWLELPWLRFLLGDLAGDVVGDPGGAVVVADSLVVTQRPDLIDSGQLERIRATPGVGLFHISDEWYRRPLGAYRAFSYVWRQHLHSGLRGSGVRPLPLGPTCLDAITVDLPEASRVPLGERRHSVAFVGKLVTTRFSASRALAGVPGALVRVSGTFSEAERVPPAAYMAILRDSTFVACPMGNVHLESFRVYEALEAGAVPIVERRPRYDYFALLFGDYPFPSVERWSQAPAVVARLGRGAALAELEEETRRWWRTRKDELRLAVQADVTRRQGERVALTGGGGRVARDGPAPQSHGCRPAGSADGDPVGATSPVSGGGLPRTESSGRRVS